MRGKFHKKLHACKQVYEKRELYYERPLKNLPNISELCSYL